MLANSNLRPFSRCMSLLAAIAVATFFLTGCGGDTGGGAANNQSDEQVGDAGDNASNPPQPVAISPNNDQSPGAHTVSPAKPPVISSDSLITIGANGEYEVPTGPPEAILAVVQQLEQVRREEGKDQQYLKAINARILGCERILASRIAPSANADDIRANKEIRFVAAVSKVHALNALSVVLEKDITPQLITYCQELSKDSDSEIATFGRLQELTTQTFRYTSGDLKDFNVVRTLLSTLLANPEAHPHVLKVTEDSGAIEELYTSGSKREASEMVTMIGTALSKNESDEYKTVGESMLVQSQMIGLNFQEKMKALQDDEPNAEAEVLAAIHQLFAINGQPSKGLLNVLFSVAGGSGKPQLSKTIFELIAQKYQNHSDPDAAVAARQALIESRLISMRQNEAGAEQALMAIVHQSFGPGEPRVSLLNALYTAASSIVNPEKQYVAKQIFELIAQRFQNHSDPDAVEASKQALVEAKMIGVRQNEAGADAALITAINQVIGTEEPTQQHFQLINGYASETERTGRSDVARRLYELLVQRFGQHSNKQFAEFVTLQAADGLKRIALVGQFFDLSGSNRDGTRFNWSAYRGKYVLIDFWATWCGPCLMEIPNIERAYKAFQAKGFEVVGVNMDNDRAQIDGFFAKRKLLWPSVYSTNPQTGQNAIATKYGVSGIPFTVLVNPEGKVIEVNIYGDALEKKLTEQLGPPAAEVGQLPGNKKTGSIQRRGFDWQHELKRRGFFVSLRNNQGAGEDDKSDVKKKRKTRT